MSTDRLRRLGDFIELKLDKVSQPLFRFTVDRSGNGQTKLLTTKHMNIYDCTDNYPLECNKCGWKGTKKEADNIPYDQFLDVRCPRVECDAPILKIPYPTVEETRLAAETGNEWAKIDNYLNLLAEQFNRD